MKRLLFPALLVTAALAACAPKTQHDEHLNRIAELEDEKDRLERENTALRARYEGPVATPAPPIETRCVKKGTGWKITPSGVDEILKNETGLRRETKARAYFEGGKYTGMRVTVTPGSFTASCGLEDGDVLQKVNGLAANPSKVPEIEASLKKAQKIELEVSRAGKIVVLLLEVAQ